MSRATYNLDLPPLPDDDAFVDAVRDIVAGRSESYSIFHSEAGASANEVAHRLHVQGASRLGSGAKSYSWSGTASPALRTGPRLRKLASAGRLVAYYDRESHRNVYEVA